MSKPRVGYILEECENPTRDAIHIPILPARIGRTSTSISIKPGSRVDVYKEHYTNILAPVDNTVDKNFTEFVIYPEGTWRPTERLVSGVLDPFLPVTSVQTCSDEYVYVFLPPDSVQSLWHEWRHSKLDKK